MAKTYKLWVYIEEYDSKTEQYKDLVTEGELLPTPIGVYKSKKQAVKAAEDMSIDHWSSPNGCHEDCPACKAGT